MPSSFEARASSSYRHRTIHNSSGRGPAQGPVGIAEAMVYSQAQRRPDTSLNFCRMACNSLTYLAFALMTTDVSSAYILCRECMPVVGKITLMIFWVSIALWSMALSTSKASMNTRGESRHPWRTDLSTDLTRGILLIYWNAIQEDFWGCRGETGPDRGKR